MSSWGILDNGSDALDDDMSRPDGLLSLKEFFGCLFYDESREDEEFETLGRVCLVLLTRPELYFLNH